MAGGGHATARSFELRTYRTCRALPVESLFFLFEQRAYFVNQFQQSVEVLFNSSLLTKFPPTFANFGLHGDYSLWLVYITTGMGFLMTFVIQPQPFAEIWRCLVGVCIAWIFQARVNQRRRPCGQYAWRLGVGGKGFHALARRSVSE